MYTGTKLVNGLSLVAKGSTTMVDVRISVHLRALRLTRVYLDKVPARNRLKSESMPTMKGVKRRSASVLVAIKARIKPSCVRGTD